MACLHGNEHRAPTSCLMSASLLLLCAVVWHVCTAVEHRASAWYLPSALLSLSLASVCGMLVRRLSMAPPPGALSFALLLLLLLR